jgi:site-specific DNA-cytosine methylase
MSEEKNSKQISLWGDSHANRSVSQVNKKEEMTTDISGQKCLDSLKKSNPSSLLERMCKELLTSKTAWSSDRCKMTWKVKVSKSNVSLYQLQASVLGINDSESGLWLTPSTMDISQRSPDAMKKRIEMRKKTGRTSIPPGSLSEQVQTGRPTKDMREVMDMETMKMYPTPRTGGGSRPNGKGGKVLEEEVMIEYGLRERGKTLKQMYPTPRASGQEDAETLIKRKGEKAAAQHNLTAHMQMFPNMKAVEEHLRSKKQSFPTPTSFDSNEITKPRKPHPGGGQKPPLNQIVQMYPTPSAQEAGEKIVGTLTSKDGSPLKPNERAYNPKTGKHVQMTLNRTVKMFPTPSASCQLDVVAPPETVKQNSSGWSVTRVGTGTKFGAKLNDVVNKIYNTPTTNDAKNLTFPKSQTNRTSLIGNMIKEGIPKPGGKLNPTFVEFLMGFPESWTNIDPSRIKSLGNAIVPQMARIFGLAIKKVLSDSDCNGQG